MVSWEVILTKQANKDAKKLAAAGLKPQAEALLTILFGGKSLPTLSIL